MQQVYTQQIVGGGNGSVEQAGISANYYISHCHVELNSF